MKMVRSLKVAVIGAGVSGLAAARELKREGHRVVVFEKSSQLGGQWLYDPRVESDPLSQDPNREIIHSSMYFSVRTNLPRELMSFSDFSLTERGYGDPRRFPCRQEVLSLLNDFASHFGILDLIQFETEVIRVERVDKEVQGQGQGQEWLIETIRRGIEEKREEVFDAVVVCNGHFTVPQLAVIPGLDKWKGKQMHSHSYRVPEPFKNQVVVLIGDGSSAFDISREISKVAKEVHISSRSADAEYTKLELYPNIWLHSQIVCVNEDSAVAFQDGPSVCADVIIHCTGYKYIFPFLNTNGIVRVDDNRVEPLYKHVFPPELPTLSFVGLLHKLMIFHTIELQSKWIAKVLSGKVALPSKEEMMADVEDYYLQMKRSNLPIHKTHFLPDQSNYIDWLAEQAKTSPVEERLKEVYRRVRKQLENHDDGLRDED